MADKSNSMKLTMTLGDIKSMTICSFIIVLFIGILFSSVFGAHNILFTIGAGFGIMISLLGFMIFSEKEDILTQDGDTDN